jgi:hypothetical protein
MSSRARIFAAVILLVGCLAGPQAWPQVQNLEAGKSASQLFAGTCNACHKSPRGLLKTVSPNSLPSFLRDHYTTSSDMASQLSSYLIANGAGDNRQTKQGSDAKPGVGTDQTDRQGRRLRNAPSQEAARPEADSASQSENGRQGRKRLARPEEGSEEARRPPDAPAQAVERSPDGRKLTTKPRRGKPGMEESPTASDEIPKAEPAMSDQATEQSKDQAKGESSKESAAKPGDARPNDSRPEAATLEVPNDVGGGEKPVVRRDPVPPVTPAAPASAAATPAVGPGLSEATAAPKAPAAAAADSPAVTASAPPAPAAGPPAPPISR